MAEMDPNGIIGQQQPIATRDGNPRLVGITARANASDFGGQVGQSLDSLGRNLDQVSGQIQEMSDKRDALYAQQIGTKAEADWKEQMSKAQQAFTLDPSQGVDYGNTYKQQFAQYQQQILDNNPDLTPNAKNLVTARLNNVGVSLFDNALSLQAKATTDWGVQSYNSTTQNIKDSANGQDAYVRINDDGSIDSSFDSYRDQMTEAAKTAKGLVPTRLLKDSLLSSHLELDKAEIDVSSDQNGKLKTAQLIQDGKLGTSLTIPERMQQVQELQRQARMDSETNLREKTSEFSTLLDGIKKGVLSANDPRVTQALKDYTAANTTFGDVHEALGEEAIKNAAKEGFEQRAVDAFPQVDPQQAAQDVDAAANHAAASNGSIIPYDVNVITSNYGISKVDPDATPREQIKEAQEASAKAQELIQDAQNIGLGRQKMLAMPLGEAKQYLDGLTKAGVNSNVMEDLRKFNTKRESDLTQPVKYGDMELGTNSASVAMGDPEVLKSTQNAEAVTRSFLNPSQLKGPTLTATQVQGANQEAISKIYAFQDQVGVPHDPLTINQKLSLATGFQKASATSPESAIQMKDSLKKAYPPQYLSDVVNSLPFDSSLGLFMALPSGSQQERTMAEGLSNTDKDKLVGEKTKDTLNKAFDTSDSFVSSYMQSQISNGTTSSEIENNVTGIQKGLRSYATVLASKNPSGNLSDAISQTSKDVLGTIWGYTSINKQTVAIPRSNGAGGYRSDADVSNISQGLQLETNNVFANGAKGLNLQGALDRYHYQDTADNEKLALNDLKQNAYWTTGVKSLTGPNEAVMMGFDHFGNRFPILDNNNKPITRDLDSMGSNWLQHERDRKQAEATAVQTTEAKANQEGRYLPMSSKGANTPDTMKQSIVGKWLNGGG